MVDNHQVVERRRPENQGAVSFIVERRKGAGLIGRLFGAHRRDTSKQTAA